MQPTSNTSRERITFARFDDMPFAEIMSVANTRRHFSAFHETYTICANVTSGGAEWFYRSKRESGHGKMLMLMEPGEIHRTVALHGSPGTFHVLHLSASWIGEIAADVGFGTTPHFSVGMLTVQPAYETLMTFFKSSMQHSSILERECHLLQFLMQLFHHTIRSKRHSQQRHEPVKQLSLARDYLIDNYDKKISLDELAGIADLTKFHFTRSFARVFGATPHAFLNHVRIARAREQLRADKARTAGSDFGFFDQSHFIKAFRKLMGVTPAQYAAESRQARYR